MKTPIELSIDLADEKDILRLSLLFQQVYLHTYALHGITHEFAKFVHNRFSMDYLKDSILKNPEQFLVASYQNNPVGVAEIHYNATCQVNEIKAPELSKLYVLNRFNGFGVGFSLLQAVEENLKSKGYSQLWLEVWQNNQHALQFYQRQDFHTIGTSRFEMSENTYDNYVMLKNLTH